MCVVPVISVQCLVRRVHRWRRQRENDPGSRGKELIDPGVHPPQHDRFPLWRSRDKDLAPVHGIDHDRTALVGAPPQDETRAGAL